MNDHQPLHTSPIRRIMVALDASASSLNALHTAVELAARFKAELLGLFVEDINLLRLAQLPFAREVSLYSPHPRPIRPLDMELQLRTQATRIRNTLARAAEQFGVEWEFHTVRGSVGSEVLAAGARADLVVIGKIGRSLPGMHRSGSTARTLLMKRKGMTLIMQTRIRFAGVPVVSLYDHSEAAGKALRTAAYLSRSQGAKLVVMIIAGSIDEVGTHQHNARLQLKALGVEATFRHSLNPSLSELAARIRNETNGPVVIPCLEDWIAGQKLCGLVDEIPNPVLLIR